MSAEEATRIARAVQRMKRSSRAVRLAIPTAAALGAGAAIAAGAIPGSDGTITGCYMGTEGGEVTFKDLTYREAPGALRLIDPSLPHTVTPAPGGPSEPNLAAVCDPQETQISWSQTGPQGPQGAVGPQGPAGSQGATGESGLPGETNFGFDNASGNMFLKLDGIKGESIDSKHKDDIEIESFQWGVGRGISQGTSASGAGAGKTTFQTFKITKTLDKSSPLLLRAAATGEHFKEADLLFAHKVSGKETDYLEIKLDNVLISSIQDGGSAKGAPQEDVTFSFQKAEEIYLNNGKQQGTVNINFAANKAV